MNIFYLDKKPKTCARYHNDKHVVKMILESNQLLCGVHWLNGSSAPYKLTHKNHPCSIWVRKDVNNYNWLCELSLELCHEYTYRYGKIHKSEAVTYWCIENAPNIDNNEFSSPPLAMPEAYKTSCPIESYRSYYINEKKNFSTWKNREVPYWFK